MKNRRGAFRPKSLLRSIRRIAIAGAAATGSAVRVRRREQLRDGAVDVVDAPKSPDQGSLATAVQSTALDSDDDGLLPSPTVGEPITRSVFVNDASPAEDGSFEVRSAPDRRNRPSITFRWRVPIETPLALCVHIHAFYLDVLPELVRSMHVLPTSTPILISVQSEDDAQGAHAIIDETLGQAWPRSITVVPNRGRNFLPLLVTFADEVAKADLVLHLHTKKSLFCGVEQIGWRQHMTRALSDTPAALAAAVALFDQHPEVGLLMPDPYPFLPVWASHWLGNQPHGLDLLRRMGSSESPRGYLRYPVGGMFWIRSRALQPLLSGGIVEDDFEIETGQTDRTMAHAIERAVAVSTQHAGFRIVELAHGAEQWRDGWSAFEGGNFGSTDWDSLYQQLPDLKLVSFDIFDTVNLRPCLDPSLMQWHALRAVSESAETADERFGERCDAEVMLRNETDWLGDPSLHAVYDRLGGEFGWSAELRSAASEEEVNVERRSATPNPPAITFLQAAQRAGIRTVAISDTGLPGVVLTELLGLLGLGATDHVYVSNEVRARKDTGALWEHVASVEQCSPSAWLHLGDNEAADIQSASDRGLRVGYVPSAKAIAEAEGIDALPRRIHSPESLLTGAAQVRILRGLPRGRSLSGFELGELVVGPLASGFLCWLNQQTLTDDFDEIWFNSRDCFYLLRYFNQIFPKSSKRDRPRFRYFPSSRAAAIGAAHEEQLDVDLLLGSGVHEMPFGQFLFDRTGFVLRRALADTPISLPHDARKVREMLQLVAPELIDFSAKRAKGLRLYTSGIGVRPTDRIGVVDWGYAGTSIRAMSRALPQHFTGLFGCSTSESRFALGPRLDVRSGFGADATLETNFFYTLSMVLELTLSEDAERFAGFADLDGRAVPITVPGTKPIETTGSLRAQVRAGVEEHFDEVIRRLHPTAFDDPIDLGQLMRQIEVVANSCCDYGQLISGLLAETVEVEAWSELAWPNDEQLRDGVTTLVG